MTSTAQGLGTTTRRWRWDRGSIDHLHIVQSPDGLLLRGEHDNIHHWIFANSAFEAQWLRVLHMSGTEPVKRLDLERRGGAWWYKNGDALPGSETAIDPDLACTVATNTLPLRRLNLALGEIADLDVLHISAPDLTPRVVRHRYMRHRGGYAYENLETGFTARLTCDDAGWVDHFPGVCRATAP